MAGQQSLIGDKLGRVPWWCRKGIQVYFTAFLLRSGHYVHVSLPIMACICKAFFCSLPFTPPPSPINYVVTTLGSTDILACENSCFSSLFKLHCLDIVYEWHTNDRALLAKCPQQWGACCNYCNDIVSRWSRDLFSLLCES